MSMMLQGETSTKPASPANEAAHQPMKIGKIETFYVPPRWLFVRVETEDGAFGWGEASLEGWAEAVDGAFEAFRDRFVGADPFRIEDIWQVGYRGGFYRGGAVSVALEAFERLQAGVAAPLRLARGRTEAADLDGVGRAAQRALCRR